MERKYGYNQIAKNDKEWDDEICWVNWEITWDLKEQCNGKTTCTYVFDQELHERLWYRNYVCDETSRQIVVDYGCRKMQQISDNCEDCATRGYTRESRPFFAQNLKTIDGATREDCQSACDSTTGCVGFSMCITTDVKIQCALKAAIFNSTELTEEMDYSQFGCQGSSMTFSKKCQFSTECHKHSGR